MAGKVKTIVEPAITPVIQNLGFEIVDIDYVKQSDGMNLIIYIDSDKGISIEDCETVSRSIDPILDEMNPTDDQPYILSVSSPGIDRPLKHTRDFQRNMGKEIQITLFAKIDGKKIFKGILKSFDEISIELDVNGETMAFSREKIAHIVPIIHF